MDVARVCTGGQQPYGWPAGLLASGHWWLRFGVYERSRAKSGLSATSLTANFRTELLEVLRRSRGQQLQRWPDAEVRVAYEGVHKGSLCG